MPSHWRPNEDFEVIVFDDGSVDLTKSRLEEYERDNSVKVLRGNGKGNFAKNNNRMAQIARGDWLCLLNNDTELTENWLQPLLAHAQNSNVSLGVVGNIHVSPDRRTVNHAGIVFDDEGRPSHLYEGLPVNTPGVQSNRTMQAVTAACCLVSRKCFIELRGFDDQYVNGFEDVDFCLRARKLNWEIGLCGGSVIVHHGSSTPGRFASETRNRERYQDKWRGHVQPDIDLIPKLEGVLWPDRSMMYLILRSITRFPVVGQIIRCSVNTTYGIRLRQAIHRRASRV